MVSPTTYRTIVRSYANGVESGAYDGDIESARERKFVAMLLRTASNDYRADIAYSDLTTEARERIVRDFIEQQWSANVGSLVEIASPTGRSAYGQAIERAIAILRGV